MKSQNVCRSCVAALGIALFFVTSASARDVTWVGPTSGTAYWTNTVNWSGGALPTVNDRVVFGSGIGTLNVYISNKSAISNSSIRVVSGTVKVPNAGGNFFFPHGTNTFDIAAGAKLIIEAPCTTTGGSAPADLKCFLNKIGGGTFQGPAYNGAFFGDTGYGGRWFGFWVKEGLVTFPGYRIHVARAVVEDGATYTIGSISTLQGCEVFEVKKGGTVNITGSFNNQCAGFIGEGTVNYTSSSGSSGSGLTLWKGPYKFDGQVKTPKDYFFYPFIATTDKSYKAKTDEEKHFVCGASNTLAGVAIVKAKFLAPEFAAGIPEFWTGQLDGVPEWPVVAENVDGEPIRLHARLAATTPVEGSGDWFAGKDASGSTTTITGAQVSVTGVIGGDKDTTLTLGDKTATGDVDLSSYLEILCSGAVTYQNYANATQAIPLWVYGALTAGGVSPLTLAKVASRASGGVTLKTDLTILGGDMQRGGAGATSGTTLKLVNAQYRGALSADDGNATACMPGPGPGQNLDKLVLEGTAELRYGGGSKSTFGDITLKGGGRLIAARGDALYPRGGTAHSIYADGGTFEAWAPTGYGYPFLGSNSLIDMWTVRVRKGGMRYDSRNIRSNYYKESQLYSGFPTAVSDIDPAEGKDGGVTFALPAPFTLSRVQNASGGVILEDGEMRLAIGGKPFGDNDMTFDGGWFDFNAGAASTSNMLTRLACGTGAKVRLVNNGSLGFRCWSDGDFRATAAAQTITVGADNAKETPFARTAGGVLHVIKATQTDTANKLLVNGPLDAYADGCLKLPIFLTANYAIDFATYDATDGLIPYTNYVAFADAAADKVVKMAYADRNKTLSEDLSVRGFKFLMPGDKDGSATYVTIPSGTTLTVGNGTAPACVIAGGGHARDATLFAGDGTLDFGGSEGVFATGWRANSTYTPNPTIDVKISGRNGVTFAGVAGDINSIIYVKKASDYTGGTHIGSVAVNIYDGQALGKDRVTAKGGRFVNNASVRFMASMTVANDFTVRGFGYQPASRNQYNRGVLHFAAPGVTLTGDVEIDNYARFTAVDAAAGDFSGKFDGVISGGQLQISHTKDCPFVFTRDNTYTGGTEIRATAKVILRGAKPSLGTGTVTIDTGVLAFENTATLVFTNRLVGTGTLQLCGEAEVKFAGDYLDFTATAVEMSAGKHVFTALPPFGKLSAPAEGNATIWIPGELGTVSWGGTALTGGERINLFVGEGTVLDLGGARLTIRRTLNNCKGRIVNGTLIETKPQKGLCVIFW